MIAALLSSGRTVTPLVLAAALTPSVGGHVTKGDDRNLAVMPAQRIELRFDHSIHLGVAGLECLDCHERVKISDSTKDFNVPARTLCLDCHDDAEVTARWNEKGRGADSAIDFPAAHLQFSHAKHVDMEGVTCSTCHADVGKATLATREHLPSMETCLSCHDGVKAPATCTTCHVKGAGGRMRTTFASGVLKPDDHGPLFVKQHEVEAERDLALCASCHAQTDCLSCHDGAIPPTFHDADYLATHPQDAFANNPPCASCHRLEGFCRDCHFRAGVTLGGPVTFGGFHPLDWNDPASPNHHRGVARKNLSACTSCHAEQDCMSCHVFYPGAPRTHPPGFRTSDVARRLRSVNVDLCLKCHVAGDPTDPFNAP